MDEKPMFEDTHCPRCGNSDGIIGDEAAQMVKRDIRGKHTVRIIWCAAGHITVEDGDKVTMLDLGR